MKLTSFRRFLKKATPSKMNSNFSRKLGICLIFIALLAGGMTYTTLTSSLPNESTSRRLSILLNIDLGILLFLSILIAKRLSKVWGRHRQGAAGAKLHTKVVLGFSLIAIIPAITVSLFSALFFHIGIGSWFDKKVQTALNESSKIATAYLAEHKKAITSDISTMVDYLQPRLDYLRNNPKVFNETLDYLSSLGSIREAIVFQPNVQIVAQSRFSYGLHFETLPSYIFEKASHNPIVIPSDQMDKVRALVQIAPNSNVYLLVGRQVDSDVIHRIQQTESAIDAYQILSEKLWDFEIQIALIFIVICLLLLLVSILVGLSFASQLMTPISQLIHAAERIRAGDLSARVPKTSEFDELGNLGRTFNLMTSDLISTHKKVDERRHFIESVLKGVSAGVIGLNSDKTITIANKSAGNLLGLSPQDMLHKSMDTCIPEFNILFENQNLSSYTSQVQLNQKNSIRTLLTRITLIGPLDKVEGYIVTFDDMTELISAQKKAAWADVARRIAHEIKNPLTPIQLSTERLRRKFLPSLTETEQTTCLRYLETIERQVGHIRDMVNEFSSFARMPEAKLQKHNLMDICRQCVDLYKDNHETISVTLHSKAPELFIKCDSSQISRVIINLIKNSIESIKSIDSVSQGRVDISVASDDTHVTLCIDDNGPGFPHMDRRKLLEPYITYKSQGTGLGLAIVNKIIESHEGRIYLEENQEGARVRIVFPGLNHKERR